jgi:hypothetical protein
MRGILHTKTLGVGLLALTLWSCSDDEVVVGEQCPSPYSGNASVEPGDAGSDAGARIYGTSCAPCADSEVELDAKGCPVYVTFASCGGDICLGSQLIRQRPEEDAGADEDAGEAREDAGD